jgi:hypothetical protein
MLEDAQKKAQWVGVPIADIKLVMMALAAVLTAQHFPREVVDWESLPSSSRTWGAWKMVFHLAHLKRQQQILALGGGEPLGQAHGVLPEAALTIGQLEIALDNLALAVMNDTAILQQLMAANLALRTTVTTLTATNKKLVDAAARAKGGGTPTGTPTNPARGVWATWTLFPSNYCWTHGHRCNEHHTSATCGNKAMGHRDDATASNTMGSSTRDKGWDRART